MLTALLLLSALAQEPAATTESPPPPVPVAPAVVRLPAGVPLAIEIVDPIGSATSHLSDLFALRLLEPIVSNGVEVVAAGAMGRGEVIDAAPSGMGGRQGKLIVSARYINLNGKRVRIRGLALSGAGTSRVDLATGVLLVPYVGAAALLIKGGEIEIPAGARATVQLAEPVELPAASAATETGNLK